MRYLEHIEVVKQEITRLGGTIHAVRQNSHIKIDWSIAGRRITQVLATSPQDWRARKNAIARVRRWVRDSQPETAKKMA